MRVFVAGASGAIGRRLVPKLIEAGHEVTGMTRSEASAERLRAAGASAVVVDVFDRSALGAAVAGARPEAVVNQLTALPERLDFRKGDPYEATNRLRTEGTRNLLGAARSAGARRFVCQSIAFLLETSGAFGNATRAVREMEEAVVHADGLDGLVLRYGFFYGPGTYYADDGSTTAEVRRRRMPVVGKGTGVFSFIHVDDAADATVAALEHGAPGVYDVVDDEPAPMSEWLPAFAEAAGARRPLRVPVWLAKLAAGSEVGDFALNLRGASNEKAKRELGWEPAHPTWRTGFAESLNPSLRRGQRPRLARDA